jgi:glyoxylase-like metal-dependent hydrolase (beta-lactamase superfamily II)
LSTWTRQHRAIYATLDRLPLSAVSNGEVQEISQPWFEAYRITDSVVVFHEPRHAEETISTLVMGRTRAVLIDTGCGFAPLRHLVSAVTPLPVTVINTHTHVDHVGGNHEFDDIAVYDHEASRRVARDGVAGSDASAFASASMVDGSFPSGFDPKTYHIAPFTVTRWLRDGDRIDIGDRELEIIHTPGESPEHICVLDGASRMLFTGDLYFDGALWAHLPETDPAQYVESYRRLLCRASEFDTLMPSHNAPCLPSSRLGAALTAFERIQADASAGELVDDVFGTVVRRHNFGPFSITTPA